MLPTIGRNALRGSDRLRVSKAPRQNSALSLRPMTRSQSSCGIVAGGQALEAYQFYNQKERDRPAFNRLGGHIMDVQSKGFQYDLRCKGFLRCLGTSEYRFYATSSKQHSHRERNSARPD